MVEVFKTNVQKINQANKLVVVLLEHFPASKINFDMHDCDKILRVEGKDLNPKNVISLINQNGFMCTILE